MGATRIIWHIGFGWRLRRQGPRDFDIFEEFVLAEEPLRIDFLLLRKHPGASVDDAQTLQKLWPLLPTFTVVEYKGPRRALRSGDLDKLWAYVHLYVSDPKNEVVRRDDICAVLAVPHRTPTLNDAIQDANLTWENLGEGYFRVHGGQFVLYVVELDVAGRGESDGIIYGLATGKATTLEADRFFAELIGTKEAQMAIENMEGYEEIRREIIGRFRPEDRLIGLDHDQQALALPLDVLKLLPKDYFQSLSPDVRAILEARLAKP